MAPSHCHLPLTFFTHLTTNLNFSPFPCPSKVSAFVHFFTWASAFLHSSTHLLPSASILTVPPTSPSSPFCPYLSFRLSSSLYPSSSFNLQAFTSNLASTRTSSFGSSSTIIQPSHHVNGQLLKSNKFISQLSTRRSSTAHHHGKSLGFPCHSISRPSCNGLGLACENSSLFLRCS